MYFTQREAALRYDQYRPKVHEEAVRWLRKHCGEVAYRRAVDVACGTGDSTVPLKTIAKQVEGVDLSESMLEHAKAKGLLVRESSYTELPSAAYDLISVCMAFHWFEPIAAVASFKRASADRSTWLVYNFALLGHQTDEALNLWLSTQYLAKFRFFTNLRETAGGRTAPLQTCWLPRQQDGRRATVAQEHLMAELGGWAGYDVVQAKQDCRGGQSWWVLRLQAVPGWLRQCSQCGRATRAVHDYSERRIRDLPLFQHRVELIVPRLRVACDSCGPKLEQLSWLEPYARVTRRLSDSVAKLCKVASVRHVAEFFGLDWKTVKALDFASLQRELGAVDLDGLEVIGMDEFAIQKGHRYATVIVEPTRKRVLWVGRGRGRADVRPFFEMLGPQRCRRLRAAVMDMNAGYEIEVKHHCPQAAIVFDLFHVVAKYGREVIDRVRVDCANALRADKPARRVVKGARWLLLKNRDNLAPAQDIQLKELLGANRLLFVVHVLRDALKDLWSYRHPSYAERAWRSWYAKARRSRIEPLKRFAANLKPYLPGILAHCRFPLGTNLIEGINNKIKVIKRVAYGFRDDDYFFLKIRAAFPGVG